MPLYRPLAHRHRIYCMRTHTKGRLPRTFTIGLQQDSDGKTIVLVLIVCVFFFPLPHISWESLQH